MKKLKLSGEGYWFNFIISLVWMASTALHSIGQAYRPHPDFAWFGTMFELFFVFWTFNVFLYGAIILSRYMKMNEAVPATI